MGRRMGSGHRWLPSFSSMLNNRFACVSGIASSGYIARIGGILSTVAEHNSAPRLERHGSVQWRAPACEARLLLLLQIRLLHWRLQYRCPAHVLASARARSIVANGRDGGLPLGRIAQRVFMRGVFRRA